jgi:hypothetical protein
VGGGEDLKLWSVLNRKIPFGQRQNKDLKKLQNTTLSASMVDMQKTDNSQNLIENMFKAGAHYGYGKSRRHPSTSSYIYTTKNKTDIIDLEKNKRHARCCIRVRKDSRSKEQDHPFCWYQT